MTVVIQSRSDQKSQDLCPEQPTTPVDLIRSNDLNETFSGDISATSIVSLVFASGISIDGNETKPPIARELIQKNLFTGDVFDESRKFHVIEYGRPKNNECKVQRFTDSDPNFAMNFLDVLYHKKFEIFGVYSTDDQPLPASGEVRIIEKEVVREKIVDRVRYQPSLTPDRNLTEKQDLLLRALQEGQHVAVIHPWITNEKKESVRVTGKQYGLGSAFLLPSGDDKIELAVFLFKDRDQHRRIGYVPETARQLVRPVLIPMFDAESDETSAYDPAGVDFPFNGGREKFPVCQITRLISPTGKRYEEDLHQHVLIIPSPVYIHPRGTFDTYEQVRRFLTVRPNALHISQKTNTGGFISTPIEPPRKIALPEFPVLPQEFAELVAYK